MKLRTQLLAGLIAVALAPMFASAAPYVGIGELQQRAQMGLLHPTDSQPATVDRKDGDHDGRYVGIGDLQQRAQMGLGIGHRDGGGGRPPEFFAAHQRQMNLGVSHIEASEEAARELAAANRD